MLCADDNGGSNSAEQLYIVRTFSHLIIAAGVKVARPRIRINANAFLIGSVAPDLALLLLSGGTALYLLMSEGRPIENLHSFMFNELFFNHPVWIISHNLLHAPLLLLAGLALTYPRPGRVGRVRRWLFWFLAATLLHTAIDIVTHHDDGPLLLFPFDWSLRFRSPISYWDPRYFGNVFTFVEYALDFALLLYLGWFRRRGYAESR